MSISLYYDNALMVNITRSMIAQFIFEHGLTHRNQISIGIYRLFYDDFMKMVTIDGHIPEYLMLHNCEKQKVTILNVPSETCISIDSLRTFREIVIQYDNSLIQKINASNNDLTFVGLLMSYRKKISIYQIILILLVIYEPYLLNYLLKGFLIMGIIERSSRIPVIVCYIILCYTSAIFLVKWICRLSAI